MYNISPRNEIELNAWDRGKEIYSRQRENKIKQI